MENSYILLRIDPFIWNDSSLNYPEKIILNFIFSWTVQKKCCHVSNDWLANAFGWEPSFVAEVISLLHQRGWINVERPAFGSGPRMMSINIPGEPNPCTVGDEITFEEFLS